MVGSVSSIGLCAIKTDWDVYHNVLFPCTDPFFYHCQLPCFLLVFLQFSLDNLRMSLKQGILMTVLVIFALGKSHIQYFTKLGNIFSANSHFTGSINHSVIKFFPCTVQGASSEQLWSPVARNSDRPQPSQIAYKLLPRSD